MSIFKSNLRHNLARLDLALRYKNLDQSFIRDYSKISLFVDNTYYIFRSIRALSNNSARVGRCRKAKITFDPILTRITDQCLARASSIYRLYLRVGLRPDYLTP